MAEAQFEGGKDKYVYVPQTDLRTAPVTGATGIVLPLTEFDVSERQGFEDFDILYTDGVPSEVMESTKPVNGRLVYALTYQSAPVLLQASIAQAVTVGAADPYQHTQTLGDQTNTILDAFAIEHHQLQAATPQYNLTWGVRVNTTELSVTATGGIVLTYNIEALQQVAPSATPIATTLTEFTDVPVDGIIQNLQIDAAPTSCNITQFTMTVDHRLDAGNFALFCQGRRNTLARQNPTVGGNISMFANDDVYPYLAAVFATPNTTRHAFRYEAITTAVNRSFTIDVANVKLALSGDPIASSGGYVYDFTYRASGVDCLIAETYNDVASY